MLQGQACQNSVHAWGRANQVEFDPSKESIHIIHETRDSLGGFKFLGVSFDTKLNMSQGILEIAAQARSRLKCLLRTRRYHNTPALIRLYKAHILSYVEAATPAIAHATAFALGPLDSIQDVFLSEICFSAEEAIERFNLAPLFTRRDVALLGLIHKTTLGLGPPQYRDVIYPENLTRDMLLRAWRNPAARHNRQLHDPIDGTHSRKMQRSLLGLIYAYNLLPQWLVDIRSISTFQHHLQNAVKKLAHVCYPEWAHLFRTGVHLMTVLQFQSYFRNEQ